MNVKSPETRMMGLPYGDEIMIVGRTMWTQSTSVTDGRTDGQTDRITITKTMQRRASHGKNGCQLPWGRDGYLRIQSLVEFLISSGHFSPTYGQCLTGSSQQQQLRGYNTGFMPICQNQIQGLFKDFQGPYEGYIRRTKLHQTGTFIRICKCCKLT